MNARPAIPRPCPTCGTIGPAKPFLPDSADRATLNAFAYASRKFPEFMSHELAECGVCETVYAPFPPSADELARLYSGAAFDTAPEEEYAAETYVRAMTPHLPPIRGGALEIGCGTGAVLPRLATLGFHPVVGVEPSTAAVAAASPAARALIRHETFEPKAFAPETFSLVCCFQTIEHLLEPSTFVRDAFGLVRPQGALVIVAHDYRYWVNRVLGRRSPIIDIEHLQLFSRRALVHLLQRAGFDTTILVPLANRYPLRYWLRLTPFPVWVRSSAVRILDSVCLGKVPISLNVGNQLAVGVKPMSAAARQSIDRPDQNGATWRD